jgi:hypothetical protein
MMFNTIGARPRRPLFDYTMHIKKNYKKNEDIKFSAHDAFLEWPLSDSLKVERLESQIIFKSFGSK